MEVLTTDKAIPNILADLTGMWQHLKCRIPAVLSGGLEIGAREGGACSMRLSVVLDGRYIG